MFKLALFCMVLTATHAAEIVTRNGTVIIQASQVAITTNADALLDDNMVLTKGQLQTLMSAAIAAATAPLQTQIDAMADAALNTTTLLQTQIDEQATRLDGVEDTANSADASTTSLAATKADKTDASSPDDVRTIVAAMIANQPASNALATSLNAKLDASQAYDDTDVANVVATIVTANGNTNALRAKLDGLTSQINEVIANQAFDCGATCAAGEYVQTSCDADAQQARGCATCAAGTFSLGGLLSACVDCATSCPGEHHRVSDCTTTSDIACSKCTQCVAGATYELTACSTETDRTCATCATCADDEYMVAACTASSNTVCAKCELCSSPDVEFKSRCTSTTNAVCMPNTYGVSTDMAASVAQTAKNSWRTITNWRNSPHPGYPSTFVRGGVMPDRVGFTALADGYYFTACNVRLDGFTSGNAILRMQRGPTPTDNDGTNVVVASANFRYRTFTVSAIVKLKAGERVSVAARSSNDVGWAIQSDASLSVFSVTPTEGLFAEMQTDFAVKDKTFQWLTPTSWRTTGFSSAWSLAAANSFTNGVYTVKQAGIFLVTYNQRFNNADTANSYIRIAISRNGKFDYHEGLTAIYDKPSSAVTLQVAGSIYCEAGDTLSPAGWSSADKDFVLSSVSSFSLARVETNYAFTADLSANINVAVKGYVALKSMWRTTGVNTLFDRGNVFDEATGTFTTPVDGYYFVSANIRVDPKTSRYLRVMIKASTDYGFTEGPAHAIHGAPASGNTYAQPRYDTYTVTGVMKLDRGAQLNVWIYNNGDTQTVVPYKVESASGFSVVCLKELV